MKLISPTGSFELSILGYSKKTTNWRERNKLQCRFSTFWSQQRDTQSLPLQTWEIGRIVTGLRSLTSKLVNRIQLSFSEPGLSVEASALANDSYRLQIQLDHALTPAWHRYPDFPMEMDIVLTKSELQEAIGDLSRQLDTYPER
ncbi:WapI family immunity protein [Spirosoma fluminis]